MPLRVKVVDSRLAALAGTAVRATLLDSLARTMAAQVKARAIATSPVDTGRMKGSHRFWNVKRSARTVTYRVGPTVDYAVYVHEGTRRRAGRPWLRRAAESYYKTDMARDLSAVVRKVTAAL